MQASATRTLSSAKGALDDNDTHDGWILFEYQRTCLTGSSLQECDQWGAPISTLRTSAKETRSWPTSTSTRGNAYLTTELVHHGAGWRAEGQGVDCQDGRVRQKERITTAQEPSYFLCCHCEPGCHSRIKLLLATQKCTL